MLVRWENLCHGCCGVWLPLVLCIPTCSMKGTVLTKIGRVLRGIQGENFSKLIETSFSAFLRLFQSFLKACLCKLIQVDLFGIFS